MIKVSVIIPTYKPGDYLWQCLDSVCCQSLPTSDFEVIVVLNGCQSPYNKDIVSYFETHKKVQFRFFQTDTAGVSNARNIGLENARGQYITFIDDDDFVSQTYLSELYRIASVDVVPLCYPLSFVDGTSDYSQFYITRDYNRNKEKSPCTYTKAKRFFSGPVYKMIHKDIIGDKRFNTSFKNGEDSIFMFEISDKLRRVAFTSQDAVYYRRIRSGSALLRKKSCSEIIGNSLRMIFEYTKIFLKNPLKYNFGFYITRILGAVHGAKAQFNKSRKSS